MIPSGSFLDKLTSHWLMHKLFLAELSRNDFYYNSYRLVVLGQGDTVLYYDLEGKPVTAFANIEIFAHLCYGYYSQSISF